MKKIQLIALFALTATFCASCGKEDDYTKFIGTWGVEKIHYQTYNTDYHGAPIDGSYKESFHNFNINDFDNGIHLIFKDDQTCEMRDSAIDSLLVIQDNDTIYIQCPDTVLVYRYTYSYDSKQKILYMSAADYSTTLLRINNLTSNSFEYENTYGQDIDNRVYIENAWLKRVEGTPSKSDSRKANPSEPRPRMPGSFLSRR